MQEYKHEKLIDYMASLALTLNPDFNDDDQKNLMKAFERIYDTALEDQKNPFKYSQKETENLRKLANDAQFLNQFNKNAKLLGDLKPFDTYQPEKSDREILNDTLNPNRFRNPTDSEIKRLLDEIKSKCQSAGR